MSSFLVQDHSPITVVELSGTFSSPAGFMSQEMVYVGQTELP